MSQISTNDLQLKYSHNIIEHLGLKLYQNKPTNVIAELISNSWDADATKVIVKLNSNEDAEQLIYIADNGKGMSLADLKSNYLIIGKKKEVERNNEEGKRKPMGRKGIGKLAPFGIANQVIVLTVQDSKVNMFELDYEKMLNAAKDTNGISSYSPPHIVNDENLDKFNPVKLNVNEIIRDVADKFIKKVRKSQESTGTIIFLSELKTKRTITPENLIKSIGNRFTVTLNRPDFNVKVNDIPVTEKDCFPEWALRIPESGTNTEVIKLSHLDNKEVNVKYWVGFVNNADWSADEAGVGVYAHGKIAQDRPFTFSVKGKEIFTRYMYAVVEADWVDELANDEISTDRTSINWDNKIFYDFYQWGHKKVNEWTNTFLKFKTDKAKKDNQDIIEKIINEKEINVRESEKNHLNDIISEITPNMSPDPEQKSRLVDATLKAWLHEPSRNLIKKLWNETSEANADEFAKVILKLDEELIPESLSLAVMFSQRVYALTKLQKNILLKNETYLQVLLENFPWILGNDFEKMIFRKALKNIIAQAEKDGLIPPPIFYEVKGLDYKQPDFVFFSDPEDKNILVVELKSPDLTASFTEFQQLTSYINYLQERSPESNVEGILIAGGFNPAIVKQKPDTIRFETWDHVLYRSRKEHMIYLAALLDNADASATDVRITQVFDLGGDVVKQFIEQMAKNNESLSYLIKDVERQEAKRDRNVKPS